MDSTNDGRTGDIFEPRNSIQFGSFEASVEINDQKTRCYAIDIDNNRKQVTTWIASEVGRVSVSTVLHESLVLRKYPFLSRNSLFCLLKQRRNFIVKLQGLLMGTILGGLRLKNGAPKRSHSVAQ